MAEGETPADHTLVYVPGQHDNVWVPTDRLASYPEAYSTTPASAPPLETADERLKAVLDEAATHLPGGSKAASARREREPGAQALAERSARPARNVRGGHFTPLCHRSTVWFTQKAANP